MLRPSWRSSIVPQNIYLVVDDFGRNGYYREADHLVDDLLDGQYQKPVQVVSFNAAETWCRDVSADVAHELNLRCDLHMRDIPFFLQEFVDQYEGRYHDVQLPLPMRLA
jgi:hypothetical protein